MLFIKKWQQKILLEVFIFTLMILAAIFLIYIVIDLFIHTNNFINASNVNIFDVFLYYLNYFIKRFDVFFPLAFIFSILKVLNRMNISREIIAIQSFGISKNKLFFPFILISIILFLFNIFCFEFLYPKSVNYLNNFKEKKLNQNKHSNQNINTINLRNGEKIIYKTYEDEKYIDVFYIISLDKIFHAKELIKKNKKYIGKDVNFYVRYDNALTKKKYYQYYEFPIRIDKKKFVLENFSFSQLFKTLLQNKKRNNKKEIIAHINNKILISLIPIISVLMIFPYFLKFYKNNYVFIITSLSLLYFFIFYIFIKTALLLSQTYFLFSFFSSWSFLFIFLLIPFKNRFFNK